MSSRKLAKPVENQPFDSPLEELSYLLSRLEKRILKARGSYRNAVVHPPDDSPKPPRKGRFSFGLRSKGSDSKLEAEAKQGDNGAGTRDNQEDSSADPLSAADDGKPKAKFIHIPEEEEFIEDLQKVHADLFVVVAFRMLPAVIWEMPLKGTINLHGSLLPNYRGAAPINWAVINGEKETGATTFFIEKEIDTGKIIDSVKHLLI